MTDANVNTNVRPTQATTVDRPTGDSAVDAYRRAARATPTGFAENPLGAMANAMDKLGRAAGGLLHRTAAPAGGSALEHAGSRVAAALAAAKANPNSVQAKQELMQAAAAYLALSGANPKDPKAMQAASLLVRLGGQLGPQGIPLGGGVDMIGLLRVAAMMMSRFGDAAGMQAAFSVESMLKLMTSGSSVEALQLRDAIFDKANVSRQARAAIEQGWSVRLTKAGEMPHLNTTAREIAISASQENASLAVLAGAYWRDSVLRKPEDRDGLVNAFLKIAGQNKYSTVHKKHAEVQSLGRHALSSQGSVQTLSSADGGAVAVRAASGRDDESADMYAALVATGATSGLDEVPEQLRGAVARFIS